MLFVACSPQPSQPTQLIKEGVEKPGDNDSQDIQAVYQPSVVVLWNEIALTAVRNGPPRPTVITRNMFMLHTAMFDAWSVYDSEATSVALVAGLRRLPDERMLENKNEAISHAAYHILTQNFSEYEERTSAFSSAMDAFGYEPVDEATAPFTPAEIGYLASKAVIEWRKNDGSNSDREYEDITSTMYAELYTPINAVAEDLPGSAEFDLSRWQPLRVPTGVVRDNFGNPSVDLMNDKSFKDQEFLTPHWGAVAPFALISGSHFRPPAPPMPNSTEIYESADGTTGIENQIFRAQVDEVLEMSADLTDREKVIAEYWADGPRSETPPGHWNALAHGISERDRHTVDADVRFYFALNCALFDAGIAAWEAKREFDYVRPISAIQHTYAGQMVEAWGGPNKGTQSISASEWQPYQQTDFVTPPFAEYVSGHSTFSAAAAYVFQSFTGSDQYYDGETVLHHSDFNSDGVPDMLGEHIVPINGNMFEKSPSDIVVLRWNTFTEAADEAGISRLYGGIHFAEGDLNGRILGRQVAEVAYPKAQSYWSPN
ncbi:MAG: vanadium-dependent haloperoxidase [Chloroflexota bacterium]